MSHNFVFDYDITLNFHPHDRKIFSQNFEAVAQPQAELHLLKVEKLDVCICCENLVGRCYYLAT